MKFDDLDARMRVFETAHDYLVLPGIYMVARIDGRNFTRLTKERPMRLITIGLTTILATLALASVTFAATNANTLTGTVGPGYTITMNKKTVKAGTYAITIHDLASIHDFHLTGPGVDKKTSVSGTGTTKWTVKLKKGTYHFVCDPHRTIMHGVLKVT